MALSHAAKDALQQAEAEGLTLLRSERSSTGYTCVHFDSSCKKPYHAKVQRGGKTVSLGFFATAEEAALSCARTPEAQTAAAAPPEPPPLTAEEAVRQAAAEGLTLLRSESSNSGYVHVTFNSRCKSKPYKADVRRGGKPVYLGYFATPEEAALCYARTPEAQAAAAAPPEPPPMTAEEALQQAEAEGLTLLRSESSNSGYKGVSFKGIRGGEAWRQERARRLVHDGGGGGAGGRAGLRGAGGSARGSAAAARRIVEEAQG